MATGLFFTYRILTENITRDALVSLVVCLLSLLSYVVIKHVTLPLTDIVFFGLVMCCLAILDHVRNVSSGKGLAGALIAGWIIMLLAILVRRNGVALAPPFIYSLMSHPKARFVRAYLPRNTKLVGAALLLGALLLLTLAVAATSTLADYNSTITKSGLFPALSSAFGYRLTELGELLVNIPASKAPQMIRRLLPWLGAFGLFMVLSGYFRPRKPLSVVDIYFGSTLLIFFVWPYNDARFWISVVPLLFAYASLALRRAYESELARVLVSGYLVVFLLVGTTALAYSTRITFAGSRFPDLYGDGTLRPSYCAALYQCKEGTSSSNLDPKTVRLLQICQ